MLYRNKKLLALAKEAPKCFHCDMPNDGTVIAAHRNEGKGIGIKASDAGIAYLSLRAMGRREAPRRVVRGRRRVRAGGRKATCKDTRNAVQPLRGASVSRAPKVRAARPQGGRSVP